MKIRKDDTVEIISGKDRGKRGQVVRVLAKQSKIVVQGINQHKKHQRPTSAGLRQTAPEIAIFDAPLHVSNVMLVCPKCGKLSRISYQKLESDTVRTCRKCKSAIDA